MSRADLEKQPYDVATMFDGIAKRYDLMNDVAAMGQVGMWRDLMVEALEIGAGGQVLDLAAGTGTSSTAIARAGARVVAADFSLGMMSEGRRRGAPVPFVGADGQHLPFADDSFDAAVISFGLRNVHEPRRALAEMVRVVRPGGRVVVCEFSTPTSGAVPHGLREVPAARAAGGRRHLRHHRGRLRVPRRIDPRVAGSGGASRVVPRGRAWSAPSTGTSAAGSSPSTVVSCPSRDGPGDLGCRAVLEDGETR